MNKETAIELIKRRGLAQDIVEIASTGILEDLKGHQCHCCLLTINSWAFLRRRAAKKGFKVKPFGKLKPQWADVVVIHHYRHRHEASRILKKDGILLVIE